MAQRLLRSLNAEFDPREQMMKTIFHKVARTLAFVVCTTCASIASAIVIVGDTSTATIGPPTNIFNHSITSIFNDSQLDTVLASNASSSNFVPTVSTIITAASGTFLNAPGSVILFNWYIDRNNVLDALTELIDTFAFTASGATSSFSHNASIDLLNDITTPYSMTMTFTTNLIANGNLDGLIQEMQSPVVQAVVPEPTTLALIGLGVAGIAAFRRKHS